MLALQRIPGFHKYLFSGWLENLDTVRRLPLGQFWGVKVSLTPTVWLFPLIFWALRWALGIFDTPRSLLQRNDDAIIFMLAVAFYTLIHSLGHIVTGKLAGSAMDELLFTATRGYNIYKGDQGRFTSGVHILRAVGGPLANLLSAGLFYLLLRTFNLGPLTDFIATTMLINTIGGLIALLPLPSGDGWTIWRNLIWPTGRRQQ